MTATFILSLDCEGKWGVADHLDAATHAQLSDVRLRQNYRNILTLLDEYHIPATFGFVGCFALSMPQLKALRPRLVELERIFPHYIGKALADAFEGTGQGWAGDWAVEETKRAHEAHEIGLHGATHVPWDDAAMTEENARKELSLLYDGSIPGLSGATTYIYPRNGVAYQHLLAEHGITGYRAARRYPSRALSLLSEFNILAAPDVQAVPARPIVIPPGYFINWRHGARKLVPVEVTRLRARFLLKRAAKENGVVHFWTHPENFASAPQTLDVLRAIVAEAAVMRDRGLCEILTQDAYCRRIAA